MWLFRKIFGHLNWYRSKTRGCRLGEYFICFCFVLIVFLRNRNILKKKGNRWCIFLRYFSLFYLKGLPWKTGDCGRKLVGETIHPSWRGMSCRDSCLALLLQWTRCCSSCSLPGLRTNTPIPTGEEENMNQLTLDVVPGSSTENKPPTKFQPEREQFPHSNMPAR